MKKISDILIGDIYYLSMQPDIILKGIPIAIINEFNGDTELYYRNLQEKSTHLVHFYEIGIGKTKQEAVDNYGKFKYEENLFFETSIDLVQRRLKYNNPFDVKNKTENTHELLVGFLNSLNDFRENPFIKFKDRLNSKNLHQKIDTNDINRLVIVLIKIINLDMGSTGNYNFYELLQAYILHPEQREKINTIVNDILLRS